MNVPWLLAAHLVGGVGVGWFYFRAMWWSVGRLAGGTPTRAALVAIVVRFALLAAVLTLVSREGAAPLLAMAAGIIAGRFVVLRQVREMTA